MLRSLVRALTASLALSVAPACTRVNPAFDGSSDEATTASTSTSTSLGPTTSTSLDPATTSEPEPTTGTTSADEDSSGSATSSDIDPSTGTTSEPPHGEVSVTATLATCVLRKREDQPFAGPDACEAVARIHDGDEKDGVMVLDTELTASGGNDRRAEIYLRFELPAHFKDGTLLAATLNIHVSDSSNASGADSGTVNTVTPFTPDDLNAERSLPTVETELANSGIAEAATRCSWDLMHEKLVLDTVLHLGLAPLESDAVLYRSSRAEDALRPTLTLTFE